ncbi:hypothetical protein HK101_005798, partial [Irineochytrium annulatum]
MGLIPQFLVISACNSFTFIHSLVVGAVNGAFDTLFKKVAAVNKKHGPFDVVLCTGDFFGPSRSEEPAAAAKTLEETKNEDGGKDENGDGETKDGVEKKDGDADAEMKEAEESKESKEESKEEAKVESKEEAKVETPDPNEEKVKDLLEGRLK